MYSRRANKESRQSRNLQAILDLHTRHMSEDMMQVRGDLIYTSRYDDLHEAEYGREHEALHRLLGIYELLGAVTRRNLADKDLVFDLFPISIAACYERSANYIENYRARSSNPRFMHNFEWLAKAFENARQ